MKMNLTHTLLQSFQELLFPKFCVICDQTISSKEHILCFECKHSLPFTKMEQLENNATSIRMLTKLPLAHASSLLYFVEEGMIREALHKLKYRNRPEIGNYLGELLGQHLKTQAWIKDIDYLIPIPLHPKKKNLRGYNQAECIADGMASVIQKQVLTNVVKRIRNTDSQTEKNRAERINNVNNAFSLVEPEKLKGKNILLIDDVLTTGATLASCGRAILEKCTCNLNLATIAIAHR